MFVGDGCLMEGISHEACSLAGTLKLGKLIAFYDDNDISIDGEVAGWFTDDTAARFEAYGWQVIRDVDGHDSASIAAAIDKAIAQSVKPTLICCKTVIGYGAPNKAGHGIDPRCAPRRRGGGRSAANAWLVRAALPGSRRRCRCLGPTGTRRGRRGGLDDLLTAYANEYPDLARELGRRMSGELPRDWAAFADDAIATIDAAGGAMATRKASLLALNAFAPKLPELVGGSADLTGSNLTLHDGSIVITGDDSKGNYVYFGVREFRDDRDLQRACPSRRDHPLLGDLPRVLRLRAQRTANGRAHEGSANTRLHA